MKRFFKAQDHTDLPDDIVEASRVLERREAALHKQFDSWDKLCASDMFRHYLIERGLELQSNEPPLLPNDILAEQAALGAMLLGGVAETREGTEEDVVSIGLKRLRPRVFAHKGHIAILQAIAAVFRQSLNTGETVDLVSVGSQLIRSGQMDAVHGSGNGAAYLAHTMESCPSSANINAYIKPILRTARLRSLWELATRARDRVLEPDAEPDEITNALRGALDAIEQFGAPELEGVFDARK